MPKLKMQSSAILVLISNFNFHMVGMGRTSSTVLANMLTYAYESQLRFLSRQVPEISGFHAFRIGLQKKTLEKKTHVPDMIMKAMTHHNANFIFLSVKIRWY